ncbi:MAG: S8 family serine peptidase [Patescibacteria group bacterium]|nr:S8 family serine peptidase [Patescibacteria group bacterium]
MRKFIPALSIMLTTLFLFVSITPQNDVYAQKLAKMEEIEEMTSDEKEFFVDQFIVKFKEEVKPDIARKILGTKDKVTAVSRQKPSQKTKLYKVSLQVQDKNDTRVQKSSRSDKTALQTLRDKMLEYGLKPAVEYVQPNYVYKATVWLRPDDRDYPSDLDWNGGYPESGDHWYYDRENLMQMWQDQDCFNAGTDCGGNDDVVVAVIDTGLAYGDVDTGTRTSDYYEAWTDDPTAYTYNQASEFAPAGGFNVYTNVDEINGDAAANCTDGVDDDGNGYIDDCYGYNPYEEALCDWYEGSPWECTNANWSEAGWANDDYGHGTFVTGAIAANVDNPISSVSPAFNVSILPIKANVRIGHVDPCDYSSSPTCYNEVPVGIFATDHLIRALDYATYTITENTDGDDMPDVDVINMSLGGSSYDQAEEEAVNDAYNAGITIVAASGNDSTDVTLRSVSYPAAFSNVIAVGASDSGDNRASYSNGGSNLDLVAAVGDSGVAGNRAYQQSVTVFANGDWGTCSTGSYENAYWCTYYGTWTPGSYAGAHTYGLGTSYASPQVAAAAAIVKFRNSNLSPASIKKILTGSATDIGSTGWDSGTGWGIVNFEELWNNVWSNWSGNGSTPGNITMTVFNPGGGDRLYQTVRGIDSKIYTRYTIDGSSWSGWAGKGSTPSNNISMTVFNPGGGDRLYQAVRGTDSKIYTRYTTDGSNWSNWAAKGSTPSDITMTVFDPGTGDRLYQAVHGVDGKIYTRYSINGSDWSSWAAKGSTPGEISMTVFNPGAGDRLYQAVRGVDGKIYTRYSTDGSNWSSWGAQGSAIGNITMEVFDPGSGDQLYQAVRGIDNDVYTRYSTDGSSWGSWRAGNTSTTERITMTVFTANYGGYTDRLYQSIRGSGNAIYTRSSGNGDSWGGWISNGTTPGAISMAVFNPGAGDKLYQAVRGSNNVIYTRYLLD